MGATVIVTGLSSEIAQTLVTIGVDLTRMKTVGDLQGGIEEAERLLGYEIMRPTTQRPAIRPINRPPKTHLRCSPCARRRILDALCDIMNLILAHRRIKRKRNGARINSHGGGADCSDPCPRFAKYGCNGMGMKWTLHPMPRARISSMKLCAIDG